MAVDLSKPHWVGNNVFNAGLAFLFAKCFMRELAWFVDKRCGAVGHEDQPAKRRQSPFNLTGI